MRTTFLRLVPLGLAVALAFPEAAQAQFRFGGRGFRGPAGFTQAGVFGQHLRSINFSRNPWAVMGAVGNLNYLYGGGGYGGGSSIDAGSLVELYKIQSEAVKNAQKAEAEKKQKRAQVEAELRYEQAQRIQYVVNWQRSDWAQQAREGNVPSQISSGWILNVLLDEIATMQRSSGLHGPQVPIEPGVLKNVSFSLASGGGGVGMVKSAQAIDWPEPFSGPAFQEQRERVERALSPAVQEAANGAQQRPAVRELNVALAGMHDRLREVRDDVPGMTYLKALEFLNKVQGSALALQQTSAQGLLNGTLRAQGNSVHEVVDDMIRQGLRFAAAAQGQDRSYAELYDAFLNYQQGLASMTSSPPPSVTPPSAGAQ